MDADAYQARRLRHVRRLLMRELHTTQRAMHDQDRPGDAVRVAEIASSITRQLTAVLDLITPHPTTTEEEHS